MGGGAEITAVVRELPARGSPFRSETVMADAANTVDRVVWKRHLVFQASALYVYDFQT